MNISSFSLLLPPASGPECDFCSSPEIVWEYPARDFVLPLLGTTSFLSLDGWVTCQKCYQLIEAGDTQALKKRMAIRHGIDLSRNGVLSAHLSRQIQQFFQCRTGPPTWLLGRESRHVLQ
jgi:hypothetical protein